MDERLEKALEFANYRTTLSNQKRNIRSRMQVLQTMHYQGGSFVADAVTISFVNALITSNRQSAIVIDIKDNPIEIEDLQQFYNELINAYQQASNEYKVLLTIEKKMELLNQEKSYRMLNVWATKHISKLATNTKFKWIKSNVLVILNK